MKYILQEYAEQICSICANRENCQEELVVKINKSVKCNEFKREEQNSIN